MDEQTMETHKKINEILQICKDFSFVEFANLLGTIANLADKKLNDSELRLIAQGKYLEELDADRNLEDPEFFDHVCGAIIASSLKLMADDLHKMKQYRGKFTNENRSM